MFDTVFPADSVEFCPHPKALDIFVCGTYKLEESVDNVPPPKRQTRRGQCLVFKVDGRKEKKFHKIQELDLPAVLDMKWCHGPPSANPILAIADSEGSVTLYEWDIEESHLRRQRSILCAPSSDILCLSLDWSSRRFPDNNAGSLVVSLSNGSLCLLDRDATGTLKVSESWHAHDFEPWIAAWDYWDTSVIYSGGDDLKLKTWDIRQGFSQPTFTNKRFEAGLTSIQSHPHIEYALAVGSYDNIVRIFDTRKCLVPFEQFEVGGGAWRVKWHPSAYRKHDLLVACMHDGFKVVRFDGQGSMQLSLGGGAIVKRFDEHKSLAYGVDWSFDPSGDDTLIASCSFYDHTLHLWGG